MGVIRENTNRIFFSFIFLTPYIFLDILELACYYQFGLGDGSGQDHL